MIYKGYFLYREFRLCGFNRAWFALPETKRAASKAALLFLWVMANR